MLVEVCSIPTHLVSLPNWSKPGINNIVLFAQDVFLWETTIHHTSPRLFCVYAKCGWCPVDSKPVTCALVTQDSATYKWLCGMNSEECPIKYQLIFKERQ